jgi:hypothetical protein
MGSRAKGFGGSIREEERGERMRAPGRGMPSHHNDSRATTALSKKWTPHKHVHPHKHDNWKVN